MTGDDELISHEAAAFYGELRGLVVVFLFFVTLLTIAHLTLQHFCTTSTPVLLNYGRTDQIVHQFVLGVCTFTLTISLIGFSLLPFSIIVNEILLDFKHSYYVQWLDTGLIRDLALIVNFGTKIVYVLIPFSFFLLIAQGFSSSSQQTFGSRLLEAFCLLIFSYVLTFGTIWSFGLFLTALQSTVIGDQSELFIQTSFFATHPISSILHAIRTMTWTDFIIRFLFHLLLRMLDSVQLVASLFGLLLLSASTPFGLLHVGLFLLKRAIHTLPEVKSHTTMTEHLRELQLTALYVKDSWQTSKLLCRDEGNVWYTPLLLLCCDSSRISKRTSEKPLITDHITRLSHYDDHLHLLKAELVRVKHRTTHKLSSFAQEWSRPLVPCIILLVILGLLYLVYSFVFFNMFHLLRNLIVGPSDSQGDIQPFSPLPDTQQSVEFSKAFSLGDQSASAFGLVGAFLQICVIYFILFLGLCGFYTTPAASVLRPKSHSLRLESLLFNVLLLLLFSSALPLQSNLLGLTTLTIPNFMASRYSTHSNSHVCSSTDSGQFHREPIQNHHNKCMNSISSAPPGGISSDNDQKQSWSFWNAFLSISFYPSSSYLDLTSDTPIPPHHHHPSSQPSYTGFKTESKSICSQFVSRAFGISAPSSASYSLILIILLYNLCFLVTSVWIAGRPLSDATRSFSLEFVTCLRCLQVQISYCNSISGGASTVTSLSTSSTRPITNDGPTPAH